MDARAGANGDVCADARLQREMAALLGRGRGETMAVTDDWTPEQRKAYAEAVRDSCARGESLLPGGTTPAIAKLVARAEQAEKERDVAKACLCRFEEERDREIIESDRQTATIERLEKGLGAALAGRDAATLLLRSIEWAGYDTDGGERVCPNCLAWECHGMHGYACSLALLVGSETEPGAEDEP